MMRVIRFRWYCPSEVLRWGSFSSLTKPTRDPNELGHPASISFLMGRNEIVAIGVTGFVCYRNGFEFRLIAILAARADRLSPLRSMHDSIVNNLEGQTAVTESKGFRLAVRLADGSKVESGETTQSSLGSETPRPSIDLLSGSFSGIRCDLTWFVSRLPPRGPIVFECIWPEARATFRHELA
jgi:hypothetical protein